MCAALIFCFERVTRCAMVVSGTRKAAAISATVRPPSSLRVSATRFSGARAGWQQVNTSRSRSSSTGPVGSAVGQIARARGARAVGIAGGETKRRALTEEFGFDVALDHRSPDFADELAAAVPDGIDVYFENVGGPVTREVLRRAEPSRSRRPDVHVS